MTNIITTTLRAPRSLIARLRKAATQQGHTLNGLILQILWDWAKKHTPEDNHAS